MFGRRVPWWKRGPEPPPEPVKPMPFWVFLARSAWSALPDFALAGFFVYTWNYPYAHDVKMVHHLTFVMLMEFLVVHATGFLGALSSRDVPRGERAFMLSVLLLFYAGMAAGFAAMYGGYWPFFAFLYLVATKAPNVLFRPVKDDAMMGIMANWAAMTALYLFGCFFTLTYEIPPLGVTPEVIAAQEFGVGGEWPEKPYLVLAFGGIYFAGLGVLSIINELIGYVQTNRRAREEVRVRSRS